MRRNKKEIVNDVIGVIVIEMGLNIIKIVDKIGFDEFEKKNLKIELREVNGKKGIEWLEIEKKEGDLKKSIRIRCKKKIKIGIKFIKIGR